MSIEMDSSIEHTLPGFCGEIDETLNFPTEIINCDGDAENVVITLKHIIKSNKNGGWSDIYTSNNKVSECGDVHELKPVKIPYEILT